MRKTSACFFIFLFPVLNLSCHSIRPLASVTDEYFQSVSKQPYSAGLVMDSGYRNYKSKDRGNAVADPQTYYIGEALVPLTLSYFGQAFEQVEVYEEFPDKANLAKEDFFIRPEIRLFDNEITLGEQEILLTLGAEIYDRNLRKISEVEAKARHQGRLGFFSSTKDSRGIVNIAMQKCLQKLLSLIKDALPPS